MPNLEMPEGLEKSELECVMLNVEELPIRSVYGHDLNEDDFFYGDIPDLQYAQGPVGEDLRPHLTLLFGIHPSETYVDDVMEALGDWEPDDILIDEVSFFPSNVEGQDYKVIVAKVKPTANLLIARKRLETLPFTNQFREYNPHVTLAYITGAADSDAWVRRMTAYFKGRVLTPTELDLGLD